MFCHKGPDAPNRKETQAVRQAVHEENIPHLLQVFKRLHLINQPCLRSDALIWAAADEDNGLYTAR